MWWYSFSCTQIHKHDCFSLQISTSVRRTLTAVLTPAPTETEVSPAAVDQGSSWPPTAETALVSTTKHLVFNHLHHYVL